MFSSYTWSSFSSLIVVTVFVYFLIIGYAYYRYDITSFLFSKRNQLQAAFEAPVNKTNLLPMVHELVSELGVVIRKAAENNPALPELLFALQSRIRDYILLENTEFRGKINLYILEELEIHGIPGIAMEEIENLWKK